MDQQQPDYNNSDNQPQSPTKSSHAYLRPSVKSRMSNESMISIPEPRTYPQKISLQSNMSEKMRQAEKQKGLFDQLLVPENNNQFFMEFGQGRTYGSNPNDYRMNRMSDENSNNRNSNNNQMVNENVLMDELQNIIIQQKITCKCSKSKCLLMYCECFSKGLVCNEQCSCYQCRNNSHFQQKRQKARQSVLERDPNAFSNKLEVVGNEQTELAHKRGCNCKKTHCFKKYCECFNAGVKCTYLCNCQGCYNGGESASKEKE